MHIYVILPKSRDLGSVQYKMFSCACVLLKEKARPQTGRDTPCTTAPATKETQTAQTYTWLVLPISHATPSTNLLLFHMLPQKLPSFCKALSWLGGKGRLASAESAQAVHTQIKPNWYNKCTIDMLLAYVHCHNSVTRWVIQSLYLFGPKPAAVSVVYAVLAMFKSYSRLQCKEILLYCTATPALLWHRLLKETYSLKWRYSSHAVRSKWFGTEQW